MYCRFFSNTHDKTTIHEKYIMRATSEDITTDNCCNACAFKQFQIGNKFYCGYFNVEVKPASKCLAILPDFDTLREL